MNDSRFAVKVGLFVFVSAALLALLILNFSSGVTLFSKTETLHIVMHNAAGLKPTADVLMSGVRIGKVTSIELRDNGRMVDIAIKILPAPPIRKDAVFTVDTVGFLGDQYIKITPPEENGLAQTNETKYFATGDTVEGKETPDLQEQIQSVSSLLDQGKTTMKDLDTAINNVNRNALSPENLAKVKGAVSNLQAFSQTAVRVAATAEGLLNTNAESITSAINNFKTTSASLTNMAEQLNQIVLTHKGDVSDAVKNLKDASEDVKKITSDLEAGKGLAGGLLKDEKMKADTASFISNANTMTASIDSFVNDMHQRGIWAMLWKRKPLETNHPPARAMKP